MNSTGDPPLDGEKEKQMSASQPKAIATPRQQGDQEERDRAIQREYDADDHSCHYIGRK